MYVDPRITAVWEAWGRPALLLSISSLSFGAISSSVVGISGDMVTHCEITQACNFEFYVIYHEMSLWAEHGQDSGIILCMRPANERRRYNISSLADRMHRMLPKIYSHSAGTFHPNNQKQQQVTPCGLFVSISGWRHMDAEVIGYVIVYLWSIYCEYFSRKLTVLQRERAILTYCTGPFITYIQCNRLDSFTVSMLSLNGRDLWLYMGTVSSLWKKKR